MRKWLVRGIGGLAALLVLLSGCTAYAIPVSALNLERLCDSSDLVVVAKVGKFAKIDQVPVKLGQSTDLADLREASVDVLNVLKGKETAETILVDVLVLRPSWGSADLDGIEDDQVKLLFLRQTGNHRYEVTDSHHPSLPGIVGSSLFGTPLEQVVSVECQVTSDDSISLEYKLEAIRSLSHIQTSCVVPTLRTIASEQIPILSLTAEAELMRRGDTISLGQAIADALSEQGSDPEYLKWNILSSIESGKFDQTAVPLLNQLATSDRVKARLAAARALMGIGIQSCMPLLRTLLSDSDQGVRYVAAIALADINNMPDRHPSIQEFQEHEEKYKGYWKK